MISRYNTQEPALVRSQRCGLNSHSSIPQIATRCSPTDQPAKIPPHMPQENKLDALDHVLPETVRESCSVSIAYCLQLQNINLQLTKLHTMHGNLITSGGMEI